MELNRKGDIGFMEALAGAMTVCLVLTAFTAFLAADMLNEEPERPEFDWSEVNGLAATDRTFCLSLNSNLKQYLEETGVKGIELRGTSLMENRGPVVYKVGEATDTWEKESRTVTITHGSGRCTPGLLEVTMYL